MIGYLGARLFQALLSLLLITAIVFVAIFVIGNPVHVLMSPTTPPADVQAMTERLGLDLPVWQQYLRFLGGLVRGDFGTSLVFGQPAVRLILERLPATLELALVAFLLGLAVGLPLGVWAGSQPNSLAGRLIGAAAGLGFGVPSFCIALLLIVCFAVWGDLLPSGGRGRTTDVAGVPLSIFTLDGLAHIALPAINLAIYKAAVIIRLVRAGVMETLPLDYVRFARAKGLRTRRILFLHVLKNALIPVIGVLGLELGAMISFALVTETIFDWPGIGKLAMDAIGLLDRPVILAYLSFVVLLFIVINLAVDVVLGFVDPRVRPAA